MRVLALCVENIPIKILMQEDKVQNAYICKYFTINKLLVIVGQQNILLSKPAS